MADVFAVFSRRSTSSHRREKNVNRHETKAQEQCFFRMGVCSDRLSGRHDAPKLNYLMYESLKKFITIALLLGNILFLYCLNEDWYGVLVGTDLGKGILADCVLVLFIFLSAVVRPTKRMK